MLHQYPQFKPDQIAAEVKAICELCDGKHHNLIHFFSFGELEDDWFYIDMELCDFTLTDYIYYNRTADELPCFDSLDSRSVVQQIWDIITQIADGVKFIHEMKYVHRDLKPNNSDSR